MKLLRKVASGLLFLLLLLARPAHAQTTEQSVPYENLYTSLPVPATEQSEIENVPVVQEIPDYSQVWLDGRVSFEGGELSTSERQFRYAQANNIPFMQSEAEYYRYRDNGYFVRLNHPYLDVAETRPYALPETATFLYRLVEDFYSAGCGRGSGRLHVNEVIRPRHIRLTNSNNYTVHPTGMAADLRVRNLLPEGMTQIPDNELPRSPETRCYLVLTNLLHEAEASGRADVTREYWKIVDGVRVANPHFHVVVIPEQAVRRVYLEAHNEQTNDGGQSD